MPSIEVHHTLPTHRKLLAAAEYLGIQAVQMMGHLVALWVWAMDNAPEGNLTGISWKNIAKAAQWIKNATRFVEALTETGWLDNQDDGLFIHDWQEYSGKYVERRRDDAARKRGVRIQMSAGNPQDVRRMSSADPCPSSPPTTPLLSQPPALQKDISFLNILREIPGWKYRGEPYVVSLLSWVDRKRYTHDQLEASAIGLAKVKTATLRGYSNLARAFQDRLNKGYDQPQGGRYANTRRNTTVGGIGKTVYTPGSATLGR